MKPAIATAFDYDIPFARMIPMIRQAGFEVIALGGTAEHSGYPTAEGRVRIRKLIEENGLEIDSVHSPIAGWPLFSLDETECQKAVCQCKMAIDAAFDLGVGIMVIHSGVGSPEKDTQSKIIAKGIESIGILSDYSLDKGVKIAVENTTGPDSASVLEGILAECSGDPVGFCYDIGHENVNGTCFQELERFGDRLLTVHLHDNWGRDSHVLPYEGDIDWDGFKKVFHSLGYSGDLLLEPM
ncbi:MAG: sugar phosphate isomerase/epimerase, partial [Candidatus Latescibacteria bacterium]|nr:sugar phosphate isomerase/epimerase [Candidatus Latescibacterota bacterium]